MGGVGVPVKQSAYVEPRNSLVFITNEEDDAISDTKDESEAQSLWEAIVFV